MDDVETTEDDGRGDQEARGRRFRSGLVAAGAAAGMTLAGLGVAAGQTDGPTSEPPTTAPAAPPGVAPAPVPGPDRFHQGPGPGGPHIAMGPGIHGEFTTRAPGGGYQTLANQQGEVTAVSSSSITVKSEDGYSRTYAVNDKTMVSAGNEGIADVATGDRVHVTALVVDGKASAVMVHDGTKEAELRQTWAPGPPPRRGPGAPAPVPAPGSPAPAPPASPAPPTTTND